MPTTEFLSWNQHKRERLGRAITETANAVPTAFQRLPTACPSNPPYPLRGLRPHLGVGHRPKGGCDDPVEVGWAKPYLTQEPAGQRQAARNRPEQAPNRGRRADCVSARPIASHCNRRAIANVSHPCCAGLDVAGPAGLGSRVGLTPFRRRSRTSRGSKFGSESARRAPEKGLYPKIFGGIR